jgi:hypothetical protein
LNLWDGCFCFFFVWIHCFTSLWIVSVLKKPKTHGFLNRYGLYFFPWAAPPRAKHKTTRSANRMCFLYSPNALKENRLPRLIRWAYRHHSGVHWSPCCVVTEAHHSHFPMSTRPSFLDTMRLPPNIRVWKQTLSIPRIRYSEASFVVARPRHTINEQNYSQSELKKRPKQF